MHWWDGMVPSASNAWTSSTSCICICCTLVAVICTWVFHNRQQATCQKQSSETSWDQTASPIASVGNTGCLNVATAIPINLATALGSTVPTATCLLHWYQRYYCWHTHAIAWKIVLRQMVAIFIEEVPRHSAFASMLISQAAWHRVWARSSNVNRPHSVSRW